MTDDGDNYSMNMKFPKLVLLLICASACGVGRSATKAELIADIMKANEVEETVDATRVEMIKQADTAIKAAMDQIRAARPQMSEESGKKIDAAADKYLKAATGGWNGADLVREYSKVYEERCSLEELTALATYLKTERAQKSIKTEKIAAQAMTDYIMSHMVTAMQAALKVFIAELQTIMREENALSSEVSPPPPAELKAPDPET
jgi:hypothetical protein